MNKLFSTWPSFTEEEVEAVRHVLVSNCVNYWTGDEARAFENEFAAWVGVRHAVALMNGSVALDVALKALEVEQGDEVVVTPRSFIASVSCVVNAGAVPVFADVDPDSGNLTAETVSRVLSSRTKVIICVHLAGWPCDMDPILDLAEQHGLYVIEDCAQAHGARYKGRSVGSMGHISTWSFCQDKIMTTGGEGGMVTCDDKALWQVMWSYKDHGKSYAAVYERYHPPGFRWVHENFGTNLRMTEMQATIGRIQLKSMSDWITARTTNAQKIREVLLQFAHKGGLVNVPELQDEGCVHAYYKFYAYVRPEKLAAGWSRNRIIDEITVRGVPCYTGSCPEIYLEKAFDRTSFRPNERLPVARELGETSLMFLVHPTLTRSDIILTCDTLNEVLTLAAEG